MIPRVAIDLQWAREFSNEDHNNCVDHACLHADNAERPNRLPFPEQFQLTPASENDLNLFKQAWGDIENRTFYGDKIYHDNEYFAQNRAGKNALMLTPVKAVKGQDEQTRMRDKAANELFSTAVSKVRQPIESLFNILAPIKTEQKNC